jgi:hypothetical protein
LERKKKQKFTLPSCTVTYLYAFSSPQLISTFQLGFRYRIRENKNCFREKFKKRRYYLHHQIIRNHANAPSLGMNEETPPQKIGMLHRNIFT